MIGNLHQQSVPITPIVRDIDDDLCIKYILSTTNDKGVYTMTYHRIWVN